MEKFMVTFCGNCGAQVQDGTRLCPVCGKEVTVASAQQPSASGAQAKNDAEANKVMAILAYLIFFIPLLTGEHKKSPFVRYHANQGTALFLFALVWGIVYGILTAILAAILINPATWYLTGSWGVYGLITTVLSLLWLVPAALCVLGIVNAVTGKTKPLPVIGRLTIIK
jgi:uncharacterized membrane protein